MGEGKRTEMVYNLKVGPMSGALRVGKHKIIFGKMYNKQGWYNTDNTALQCARMGTGLVWTLENDGHWASLDTGLVWTLGYSGHWASLEIGYTGHWASLDIGLLDWTDWTGERQDRQDRQDR